MKRLSKGRYKYHEWEFINQGYHSPDKSVIWEAFNTKTKDTDAHGFSKKELKKRIDAIIDSQNKMH